MLSRSGIETGVSLEKIIATSEWLQQELGRSVPAMLPKAGIFPKVVQGADQSVCIGTNGDLQEHSSHQFYRC